MSMIFILVASMLLAAAIEASVRPIAYIIDHRSYALPQQQHCEQLRRILRSHGKISARLLTTR